jgi:hypothetical protein
MTDPVGDLLQRGVFEVPQLLLSRQGSSTFLSAVHLLTCKPDQGRHHSSELCTQRSKELHENCLYPSLGRADLVRHSDAQDCGAFSWPSSCHRPWKYLSSSSWREQQMVVSRRFQVRVVPFKMSEVQPPDAYQLRKTMHWRRLLPCCSGHLADWRGKRIVLERY